MVRVFANGPGNQGSIPGRVIPKTQKMVINADLLNTQHYKMRMMIKGKVEQSKEKKERPLLHLVVVAIEKRALGSLPTILLFTYERRFRVMVPYKRITFDTF